MLKSTLRAGALALAVAALAGCVATGGRGGSPFGGGPAAAPAFTPQHNGFKASQVLGAPSGYYQGFVLQEQPAVLAAIRDALNTGRVGEVASLGDPAHKGFVMRVLGTSPGGATFDDILLGGKNFQGQRSTMKGCLVLHHYVFADGWRRIGGYAHACPSPEYDAWSIYPASEFQAPANYWQQILAH